MVESLSARVGRVMAASAHALLDRIEDGAPEAMMEQALREVDKVIDEVRGELGRVAANRHLAQQQHADLNRRHSELTSNIEHAVGEDRDDLARAAVSRQLDIEAQLPVLERTLADLSKEEAELKGYVDALLAKKRDMGEALLQFRTTRAKAASPTGPTPQASTSRSKMDQATAAFDRVFERQTGLTGSAAGASLEQAAKLKELEDMVRSNKIEERLAQLKAARK